MFVLEIEREFIRLEGVLQMSGSLDLTNEGS